MTRAAAAALLLFTLVSCGSVLVHVSRAENPPPPAVPAPILPCDRDRACTCWACAETEADRRALGAPSAVCQQKYFIPCLDGAR